MGLISKVTFWWKHDAIQSRSDHRKEIVSSMRELIRKRELDFSQYGAAAGFSVAQTDFLWKWVMLEIYLHNHLYDAPGSCLSHATYRTGMWLELLATMQASGSELNEMGRTK